MDYITDIFKEVTESIAYTGDASIVDNLDGTYTVTVLDIDEILLYSYVSFPDSLAFTDEYKVTSIDSNNSTFNFSETY